VKKPRVGVDVDGVLGDLLTPMFELLNSMFGLQVTLDVMKEWDFDHLIPEGRLEDFWDAVGEPGFQQKMRPYPGAVDGMKLLGEVADVYIVTSYLHNGRQWVYERDAWILDTFGVPRHKMVHTKAKYTFFGKMLVDDKPENVEGWGEEHPTGVPVIWSRPYNEPYVFNDAVKSRMVRTADWSEVAKLVEGMR
jgi:5'(3')-deoxyribonucleotidase